MNKLIHPDCCTPANNTSASSVVVYTCPMHPEVQQDHPGQCPMSLFAVMEPPVFGVMAPLGGAVFRARTGG